MLTDPSVRHAPTEDVAFEEFTRPWRCVARSALAERCGTSLERHLTSSALQGLERLLAVRLSDALSLVLFGEFTAFRAKRSTPWERLLASSAGVTGERRIYDEFVQSAAEGGMPELLRHYPVLADLTAMLTDQWVEATAELVARLERDVDDLTAAFGGGRSLGQVANAVTGLSDPHRGGRTVSILTFESGIRVVYKPKDLGTERAFGRLLDWLESRDLPLGLRSPAVLVCDGYGWAEYLEHSPCADTAALGRYYRRAGMLACVVYVLAGSDCHRENLIAGGEYPVLVDVECLLGHRPVALPNAAGVHEIALEELRSGVLGTGLLPSWQVDDEDEGAGPRDISGLHVPEPEELVERARRWEHANTDAMALRVGPILIEANQHVPLLEGYEVGGLADHAGDLMDGFAACYRTLLRNREGLLAADGPIATLARQRVRFLFRNTRVYGALYQELLHPRFLRSWGERVEELQRLHLSLAGEGSLEHWSAVVVSEIEALNRCDVPHFTAFPDSDILILEDGSALTGCLREPSHQLVVQRIRGLGEADLALQLGFIAGSLHAEAARQDVVVPHSGHPTGPHPPLPSRRTSLLDAALAIARNVSDLAVRSDGGATWIAPQYLPRLERYQLQPVGLDLHSGGCGMAVFLSAVTALHGDRASRRSAHEALRPVQQAIDRSPADFRHALGAGGATGVGSVVYALVRCAELLNEDALLETAARAARVVDEDHVGTAQLDVFAGLAGDLLALLALHRATGDADVLDRAVLCGDRLVETARPGLPTGRAWPTLGAKLLTGFSHGAAGIIHALARLADTTGTAAYADAARAAVTYEDSVFDADTGNWPDLREDDPSAFKVNWCHGAPGIGLARLGTWRSLGDPDLLADVHRAVATTLTVDLDGPDHLCCGNLGRADLLLAAGVVLDRPDLMDEARARAAAVVDRAGVEGAFRLHSSLPRRVHMPGFFMGLSGVGYALLRTAHPDMLPSVLAWD